MLQAVKEHGRKRRESATAVKVGAEKEATWSLTRSALLWTPMAEGGVASEDDLRGVLNREVVEDEQNQGSPRSRARGGPGAWAPRAP